MAFTATVAAASIVPFDPTVGIAAVASAALFLICAFVSFLALAPAVSSQWAKRLGASETNAPVEPNEAD